MTTLLMLLALTQNPFNTPYCKAFAEGWRAGYCQGQVSCIAPPPPACPVQNAGTTPNESGWTDGYARAQAAQRKKY